MKRILSLLLCAALLCCFATLGVFAEEETTAAAEETTEATSAQSATHIVFNSELTGKKNLVISANHMAKGSGSVSKSDEWPGIKIEIANAEDPHLALDIEKFCKRFSFDEISAEAHPFIVIRILTEEILFDDFEIYYCAGQQLSFAEEFKTASDYAFEGQNGDVYFIFDLTGDAEGAYHQLRIDLLGAEEESVMYMTDLAFFATEDEALEWSGYNEQPKETTEQPTTEEPTTEQPSTEAVTKMPSKTEQVKDEKQGCGSVIGTGFAAIALLSLGAACIKKRD